MLSKLLVLAILGLLVISQVTADEFHHLRKSPKNIRASDATVQNVEKTSEYWNNAAQETLRLKLAEVDTSDKLAKNVIFFLGDAMSVQTVSAARIFTGGDESSQFPFEKLPSVGYSKTYCVDTQTPDSACTATAYHTGVKTLMGSLGMDARSRSENCDDLTKKAYKTEAISQWALDAGMSVGLITNSRITDASPAPLFVNVNSRFFETDQDHEAYGCDSSKLYDMAEQLIYNDLGKNLKVVLGGGRSKFLDKSIVDEEGVNGSRGDGKNLIEEWKAIHQNMGASNYVWNRTQLLNVDTNNVDYLLGLFAGGYMDVNLANVNQEEPSVEEMVEVAVKILSKNKNGFYLFVENGLIDIGHHANLPRVALDETRELGKALEKAKAMTNAEDTLYVVSSDHSSVMTYGGFSERRNNVLGLSTAYADDGLPKTTLSYANGPGYKNAFNEVGDQRVDLSNANLNDFLFEYPSLVPTGYAAHGADDVLIFAGGPRHNLFSGSLEQNAIPYLMAFAAKIGPYEDKKKRDQQISRLTKGKW